MGSCGERHSVITPMARPSKYSPELFERAVRMVQDHSPEYPSEWVAVRSVDEKLRRSVEVLRRGVKQAERYAGQPGEADVLRSGGRR